MRPGIGWDSTHRDYLQTVYELTEGQDRNGVSPAEVDHRLGLTEEEGWRSLRFLVNAGTVVWPAKGQVMLTTLGLDMAREFEEVEALALASSW
jgi:Mn-dependent DtxR family transcriptional regulator